MGEVVKTTRIAPERRKKLQDIIPISTPMLLLIEPTNYCNQKCRFCPTSDKHLLEMVHRKSLFMPERFIDMLVSQLHDFPEKIKKIHLYKDGEPLLYPYIGKLISMLKQANVAEQICLKTNGLLMNPAKNQELISAGLDWLGVSVASADPEKYFELTNHRVNMEDYIANIRDFYERDRHCHLYVKLANFNLSKRERDMFFQKFQSCCDTCAVENLHGWTGSEGRQFQLDQDEESFNDVNRVAKIVCPYPFYALAVNAIGTVSICCNDWAHRTVVGDISKERLIDIWNGEQLMNFRRMHLEGLRRNNPACADCSCVELLPDNIDNFREDILRRILTKNARNNG